MGVAGQRALSEQCHVRVALDESAPLDYVAERGAAERFADAMRARGSAVIVDDNVSDDLRPLPCERLWKP